MTLSAFTMLCNYHHYWVSEHFHHPQRKPQSTRYSLSIPLSSAPDLFLSLDLPAPDMSYKGNHISDLLVLASFTSCNIFKGHECCRMRQNTIPIEGRVIFRSVALSCPFTSWWTFGRFCLFAVVYSTAVNVHRQFFCLNTYRQLFWVYV